MSNYYNLDGIKTELNKRISRNKTLLKAWENVTFPTKKDGKPFAILSKNFENASYRKKQYVLQDNENELVIFAWDNISGSITDSIDCYNLVKYLKDEEMKAKTQNYMKKETHLEQVYKYDLDDIKKAVADRIDYLKNKINSFEKQLENVNHAFYTFKENYSKALKQLENDCLIDNNNEKRVGIESYSMILETVKERFPYC